MVGKFEVYEDKAGKYRWRLRAGNGEIVASGESYETRIAAVRGTETLRRVASTASPVALRRRATAVVPSSSSELTSTEHVVREVLSDVSAEARSTFVHAVGGSDPVDNGLDEALWGPAPSRSETRTAAVLNLQREFESRRRLLADSITRAQAAQLLSVSEQAISALISSGNLLAMKEGREHRLPVWQFSPDTLRGFLPGLGALAAVFPGGPTSMSEWAMRPNVELGGTTPAAALAEGRVDQVVEIARSSTATAW